MSSDLAARGFCRDCGTPLYYRFLGGERIGLTIGSFDDPHSIPVLLQFGNEARHPAMSGLSNAEIAGATEDTMAAQVGAIASSNHQHPDHDTARWPE